MIWQSSLPPSQTSLELKGVVWSAYWRAGTALDALDRASEVMASFFLWTLCQDNADLYEHLLQVGTLTSQLAAHLLLNQQEQMRVTTAALLHDVGKLMLPRTLLDKPSKLSPEESALIQQHCVRGARVLKSLHVEEGIIQLVSHHHERWDGQGYPAGLAGCAIPFGARLIAIADAYVVMTTSRPYQAARGLQSALRELEQHAGTQFDPLLVEHCLPFLRAGGHQIGRAHAQDQWQAARSLDGALEGLPALACSQAGGRP